LRPVLATAVEGAFGVIADLLDTAIVYFHGTLVDISTIDAISTKSILAATIEGPLSVITDCMEAAVVCIGGTFIDIFFTLFPRITSFAFTEILFVCISVQAK